MDQSPLLESGFGVASTVFSGVASIILLAPRLGAKVSSFTVSNEVGAITVSVFGVTAATAAAGNTKVNFFSKLIQTSLQT